MEGPQAHRPDLRRIEAACRVFLTNAAARHWAATRAQPGIPSADYVTGFAAGREAAEMEAFALVVSMISGESATSLITEAGVRAEVDAAFPVEVHFEPDAADAADAGDAGSEAA